MRQPVDYRNPLSFFGFLYVKYLVIRCAKYLAKKDYLIGIDMSLPNLDLCDRTAGYVTAARLQSCRHLLLCKVAFFAQAPYVISYFSFDLYIHLYLFAPIQEQNC